LNTTSNDLIYAVVPAGGAGTRFGADRPKQYLRLYSIGERSVYVIEETVRTLLQCRQIKQVVVVVAPQDIYAAALLNELLVVSNGRLKLLFEGGVTRRDSVLAGCRFLQREHCNDCAWVLVHDAARPGASAAQISAMIESLVNDEVGGLLAIAATDTLKVATDDGKAVHRTEDRRRYWHAQTPQMFRLGILVNALSLNDQMTDEASAIEALGLAPKLIEGSRNNFKITTSQDLVLMQALKQDKMAVAGMNLIDVVARLRVGQGYDSHALVPGRKLILGGVHIPFDKGLLGHSDADALLHAITDALLGATGCGDIGRCFPDTDGQFEDADSAVLLAEVFKRLSGNGWRLANVDATIIAQAPKLEPYMNIMVATVAKILQCEVSQVNIKAKTNERLGHLGRGEAIAVHAVAMMVRA
jgi:2-C-methyl-D-erythritol 4-phosphate cytidylyltransferase / 2-C-methyl-D-erythritol 2,4-cyclodiphosphate synthase